MIDEARTLELFGYTSYSLSYGSGKKICAVCDKCGKIRIVEYRQYNELCNPCVRASNKTRLKMSKAQNGEKNGFYGKKHSDETKRKISEANKGRKHSDEARKKISDGHKGIKISDETKQKISEANKGRKHSDEARKRMSDSLKSKYAGEKNGFYGKQHSDETKRKISEAKKGKYAGDKSPTWKGGVSFEPYCPKFNYAFKESIREKFGRVCFLCPTTEEENGRKLCVHHVDYDKNCLCDDVKCEFVPLCDTCHSKTNTNRGYWENLIIEKLKGSSKLLDQFRNK